MSKSFGINKRRLFEILLSISLVVAGICLIGGCLSIYYAGKGYTREIVKSTFSTLAVPVYIALALCVVDLVWRMITPTTQSFHKAPKNYTLMLTALYEKRDLSADANVADAVLREQRRRRRFDLTRLLVSLAGCAVVVGYLLHPAHYSEDINSFVIHTMWVALPCFVLPAALTLVAHFSATRSYQREIDLLKTLPKKDDIIEEEKTPVCRKADKIRLIVVLIAVVLAVAAIVFGAVSGGTVSVLTKAAKICTECIGLG